MTPSQYPQRSALAMHVLLILLLPLWTQFSALGFIAAAILLLPLRGIARGDTYTCGWASMLLTFYCGLFLADAYAHPQSQWPAFALSGVSALEFLSLVLFVRLRARERRALIG